MAELAEYEVRQAVEQAAREVLANFIDDHVVTRGRRLDKEELQMVARLIAAREVLANFIDDHVVTRGRRLDKEELQRVARLIADRAIEALS